MALKHVLNLLSNEKNYRDKHKELEDNKTRVDFYGTKLEVIDSYLQEIAKKGLYHCYLTPNELEHLNIPRDLLLYYLRDQGLFVSVDSYRDIFDYTLYVDWGDE